MHSRKLLIRTWSAMALLLMLSGCFQIRPVEPPGSATSDWISPTDYSILLDNLKRAVNQGNAQNYLRCFQVDSFRFFPVARLYNDNETIWANWSALDEQGYLDNVLANLSVANSNNLVLAQTDLQDVTSDSLRYVGDYSLRVNHTDTSLTTLFAGQLQLLIKRNTFNEWEIHRWADIEIEKDSSWSELKLRYVQ
ncbi:MAG: hypothetical protein NWR72_10785 [Bacteroidia bacterium]|nr:hypothetical protein [Bacteroidia bacterium]